MAQMNITVNEILFDPAIDYIHVEEIVSENSDCETKYKITVTPVTTVWFEWNIILDPPVYFVDKLNGNQIANFSGELLSEETEYLLTIGGFKSPNVFTNNVSSKIQFLVKESQSSSNLLAASSLGRTSTAITCPDPDAFTSQ